MTDDEPTFTTGESDPADFTVDQVNEHLSTADQEERGRVLAAEADGEERKGILYGPYGTGQTDPPEPDEDSETQPTGSGTVNQEGAPAALVDAVEESEELGYVAPEQNPAKPAKPDYSQRNPDVMNGGA